jgi:hypothetical protein
MVVAVAEMMNEQPVGFNEQIFGLNEQILGRDLSDKQAERRVTSRSWNAGVPCWVYF